MPSSHPIVGFDPGADDVGLVVMSRGADGKWRVEYTEGPSRADLDRMVARFIERTAPPRPVPLAQRAVDWLREVRELSDDGPQFHLTEEQIALIQATYARLAREGKVAWFSTARHAGRAYAQRDP